MNAGVRFSIITLAAILAIGVALSLGQWQLSRAAQKAALQTAMQTQGEKGLLNAAAVLGAVDPLALVHQPARLQGTWLADQTVYLDNRQMGGRNGFFVVTPLVLQGGRAAILVQRGWVPRNFEDRASLVKIETPSGIVDVQGRIAPPPAKLYDLGATAGGTIRQNLDLQHFKDETKLPLVAVTLQQTGAASEGLLRDWPAVNAGVDKHYGYAFQWFGLAALFAGLYVWFQIVRRFIFRPKGLHSDV